MIKPKWVPVANTSGRYEVCNLGLVRNGRTKKELRPRKTPVGYLRVSVTYDDGRRDAYIHRLVAEAFCNHPEGLDVVNHIDNDPANNKAENLEWTTQRGNVLHAMDQDRVKGFPNARAVIGEKDGKILVFRSAHEAAQATGCDRSVISKICSKKYEKTKGWSWQYVGVG